MNIAFIPARGASKGIPSKNIKSFCGKPLIYWVMSALEQCALIDIIVLATESEEIADCAQSFKLAKAQIYSRSVSSSQDGSPTEDVMLEYINSANLDHHDTFLLIQATSPYTQASDISNSLELFKSSDYDSLLSVVKSNHFIWSQEGQAINYDYHHRPRRQDFQGSFLENGAIYINTVGGILKNKNRLHGKIGYYIMPSFTSLELDNADDWPVAEYIMNLNILQKP